MPSKINQLLKETNLPFSGKVSWGNLIKSSKCGFYIVAMSDQIDDLVCMPEPQFNDNAILDWMNHIQLSGNQIKVDGIIADLESIKDRLKGFWLPDETILYIGKAGPSKKRTISKRVINYYKTPLGYNKPHAGGHWIHTLNNIATFNIFFAEYMEKDILEKEAQLISNFMQNVTTSTKLKLFDPINCYPFANKELHLVSEGIKIRKKHGLKNQTVKS